MVTVQSVDKGSPAERAGVLPGDILISVNGHDIRDVLDYRFYLTEKKLDLLIHRGPELFTLSIQKGEYDDIGLEFETYLMDKKQTCRNKCIFCFIDQNPKGMRDTIYFKDDDSRLSFLMGNYVTLTNMTDEDIDRIIRMKMSPINISVHTTNPALRCKMLNNRFAGDSLRHLRRLAENKIIINAQIVLCRGVNDGDELDRTLADLKAFYPNIGSVAIVPAGMTRHRDGLYPLSPFSKDEASAVIDQIDRFGTSCLKEFGVRLFYPSDEFFLTAERELPGEEYYDGYPQLENGVGMIRSMETEFDEELPYLEEDYDTEKSAHFSIATGRAAYDFICRITHRLLKKCPNLQGEVYLIENDFFGRTITVAGLICGCDLIAQLKGKDLGDTLYLSSAMLRDEGDLFLDNVSIAEVERELGVRIVPIDATGQDFIGKILG
ncbi:MAG: DUF512 domain-containing protein [Eubacteriales bacterium]